MDIVDVKENNLKESYNKIIDLENYNNPIALYGVFYDFLFNLFSLREGQGESDTECDRPKLKKDTMYGALKYIYEIYKHSKQDITKLNIFVYKKKYPYSYPFNYSNSYAYFNNITDEIINTQDKQVHRDRFRFLYNKYLNGLTIKNVVSEIFNEILIKDQGE